MNGRTAGLIFLLICIMLAILLLTKTITSMVSGIIFAIALVMLGGLSKGFRKDSKSK
jgi:uncharacterized membrane protein